MKNPHQNGFTLVELETAARQLSRAGMTALGARQALSGQMILDPSDRAFVAHMINTALLGKTQDIWKIEEGVGPF